VIGFREEASAANALAALKGQLALKARALRDGEWREIAARDLAPGDIVRIRLGDIIPADVKLIEGDYLSVDQAALTGESLPVDKKTGEVAFSGSIAKQGEMVAVVTGTGANTFFGRTAKLVETAGAKSHLQESVLQIGNFLIFFALTLIVVLSAVELYWGTSFIHLLKLALILLVASIPVAMPAVLSVTMALGALKLSKLKAIVSRMEAIEEMAGVDILCSDKTGTLTQNRLTLGEAQPFGVTASELILAGALASKAENNDAIDLAVIGGLGDASALKSYRQIQFAPFDPVGKRTEATVQDGGGQTFKVTKGAPQVVMQLCQVDRETQALADRAVDEFAAKGFRTLGVARTDAGGKWVFLGILPLFDPPREDSASTIAEAGRYGIAVKMVTGDNIAIAKQISGQLGIGTNIRAAEALFAGGVAHGALPATAVRQIEEADGFAQVFPEHKYGIVKALQQGSHIVAMTGDGVNDAPALKRADIGVAMGVNGTEAAKEAAAMVLADDNFASIAHAVEEGRTVYDNLRKALLFILPTNGAQALVIVAAILLGVTLPITPVQILWVNMVTAVTLSLALAFEPAEANVMQRPPRDPGEPLLSGIMLWRIGAVSVLLVIAPLGLFLWEAAQGRPHEEARTLAVNALVVSEIFYLFNSRYIHGSVLSRAGLLGSRPVLVSIGLMLLLQLAFTYFPPLQRLMGTEPIRVADWGIVTLAGVAVLLLVELEKAVWRGLRRRMTQGRNST